MKIIDDELIQTIEDLKDKIEGLRIPSASVAFNFLITDKIYKPSVSKKIEKMLGAISLINCHLDVSGQPFRDFVSSRYWQARSKKAVSIPFTPQKVKLLIHIRRGDRIWIELQNKFVLLHGSDSLVLKRDSPQLQNLNQSNALLSKKADQFTKPIEINAIKQILNTIFSRYDRSIFSIIIISDGYDKAFQEIRHALKSGRLVLSLSERKQMNHFFKRNQQEMVDLAKYCNGTLIIGENSKKKFMQSIHAVACADCIIKTTGGFIALNRLLRGKDSPSLILDCSKLNSEHLDSFIAQIEELMN
ncbi:MAG: hypothetical protein AB4041_12620 [Microcystaceae cyanobacterium]